VDPAPALAKLAAALTAPLPLPKGAGRVLVSPIGTLTYVPFGLLLPDREIAYVPSATTWGVLKEQARRKGQGVLALGDPAYDKQAGVRVGTRSARLAPLPETRKEVAALGTSRLLGKEATESGFRKALAQTSRWRAVHFACHGLVDAERPLLSGLALTRDEDDDGLLTALEVFRMKIPADLAALSACESGRGRTVAGEGILGLSRAFMLAGPPRVLCSLWKVDDEATRALMIKFYELWNPRPKGADAKGAERDEAVPKPLGAAAALKQAQAFVRSQPKWQHPYFWAAWVLWGLPD
jgi:CHAT domain-containing protein